MILYHSITFGDKNTWDNWHIVPTSRPVFNPPKPKTKFLEIEGGNGLIDLSESLTGYPVYSNREGSFEFIVMNDYKEWQEAYSDISDYLHGQKMKAVLEDDQYYFYEGRFSVNNWKSDKNNSFITIDYNVAPYKTRTANSKSGDIAISGSTILKEFTDKFYGKAPVCPTFHIETQNKEGLTIQFYNASLKLSVTKRVSDGKVQIPEIVFYGDKVQLYFLATSSGTVKVTCPYRRL